MSDWTPALWGYALFTVCVFVLFALWASEVRESVWDDEDEAEARRLARLAFAAPFWPLLLAFAVVRGLVRLARLARGLDEPAQGVMGDDVLCPCLPPDHDYAHYKSEHDHDCDGQTLDPPCGGCMGCIVAQIGYYESSTEDLDD